MRVLFVVIRLVAGVAIATAIVAQFVHSLQFDVPSDFTVNFFSFFTILSNCLAVVTLLLGAGIALRRPSDPHGYNVLRACAVTYMATTGVVYNLLLRDISLDQASTLPWSNEILHLWAPVYLVLDWVLAPGRRRIPWQKLWIVTVFPVVWAVYTLVRGALIGWYPYPFLNPAQPGGYGAVALYVIAIAGFILIIGLGVTALSRTPWPHDPDDAVTDAAGTAPRSRVVAGREPGA